MHSITKCRGCGTVMGQCRCPALNKTVRYSECTACARGRREGRVFMTREEAAARYPERQEHISESAPLTTIIEAIADIAEAFDSSDVDTSTFDSTPDTSFEPGGGDGGGGGASGEW